MIDLSAARAELAARIVAAVPGWPVVTDPALAVPPCVAVMPADVLRVTSQHCRAELVVPVHVIGTRDTDQVAALELVVVAVLAATGATAAAWRTDPPRYELAATLITTA